MHRTVVTIAAASALALVGFLVRHRFVAEGTAAGGEALVPMRVGVLAGSFRTRGSFQDRLTARG